MRQIRVYRLKKLIRFLNQLDESKFYFSYTIKESDNNNKCGTVCCAIGWTPKIFPHLVKWDHTPLRGIYLAIKEKEVDYSIVAEYLFNIKSSLAEVLFSPTFGNPKSIYSMKLCTRTATPKQLAYMLTKFIKLTKAGKIKGHYV